MAKKREMLITIGSDGEVQIQVEGVSGKGCLDFTKFLEEELGDVTERVHTAEYYQEDEEELKIQVGD
jgi:acylphosphatase